MSTACVSVLMLVDRASSVVCCVITFHSGAFIFIGPAAGAVGTDFAMPPLTSVIARFSGAIIILKL